jgi:hypothetical protein
VPQKIQNTTAIVAISNRGVEAFQLFDKGTKGQDFMGFMSNLT